MQRHDGDPTDSPRLEPCLHCGTFTAHTTELYIGGRGYQTVPYCSDAEGCGLVYAAWLRHELSEAEYVARWNARKAAA